MIPPAEAALQRREVVATTTAGELRGWVIGSGEPVLVLHGGPGLSYGYLDDLVAELAGSPGLEVATYQQRGLAPSTADGPFHLDREVLDVLSVLDALGWARAFLVGHSWGGHLALHVAVRHGERVRGVVAVDPLGAVGDGGVSVMSARMDAFVEATAGDEALASKTGIARVWPAYFADPAMAPPMPPIEFNRDANAGIFESVNEAMPDIGARLGACEVPFVFVVGERSPLEPAASSAPTAALLARARMEVLAGAGHFPWVEQPGSVRHALEKLVAST